MVVATTFVKIVIPAFIKQHIVQDFMMGRSWYSFFTPFPNKRHISNRLRRKPKHSHTHGQRRKLSDKLAFREAARRCHRHGNGSKAGDAVCCWWLNQPNLFFLGIFYDFSTFIFPWGCLGIPKGISKVGGWTTNPSGFFVRQIGSFSPQFCGMKIIQISSFTTIRYSPCGF